MQWDEYFIRLAKVVAEKSKDLSSGCGAVIVGKSNEILSTGYNGFPRGVNDRIESRNQRPVKYLWTEHAERNAIYNAARNGVSLEGCSMYIVVLNSELSIPCADCSRATIQTGIRKVFVEDTSVPERWEESGKVSLEMLRESGVELIDLGA